MGDMVVNKHRPSFYHYGDWNIRNKTVFKHNHHIYRSKSVTVVSITNET